MGNFARLVAASKADFDQSPRLPNGEGKRGQGSSSPASRPASEGQARAPKGTIPSPSGRKWVARSPRFGSQTLATAIALAVALALLLISSAHAHVGNCHSRKCDRRVHVKRAARWCRTHPICIWRHRWHAEEPSWRAWAHRTEGCESGHNPKAVSASGTYRGSMQFDLRTWREAGGWGDPIFATIYEQRVRAIELAKRVGTGRWPVCGH